MICQHHDHHVSGVEEEMGGSHAVGSRHEQVIIVISIKIENINPRVHKDFVGLDCIRLIWNDYKRTKTVKETIETTKKSTEKPF